VKLLASRFRRCIPENRVRGPVGPRSWTLLQRRNDALIRHIIRDHLNIECSLCRLIRRPEHLIGRHCGVSRQTEGHSFCDHLISESVSVTPLNIIEASIVLCLYDSCESMSNQFAL
jgi:hypothetical protein